MVEHEVFQWRSGTHGTASMASGLRANSIDRTALCSNKVSLWASRGNRPTRERTRANANLLKCGNSFQRLLSIGSIGPDEAFDTFIGARCWLPFGVEFSHMLNSSPGLRLDDCETCLLSGCWLDLLAIDDNTGKSTARPILCVLYAWAD